MRHIAWDRGATPERVPKVLNFPPTRFVAILAPPEAVKGVLIHWAGERSQPHEEADCPYCRDPKTAPMRWEGFLPALARSHNSGPWKFGVFRVTEAMTELLERDYRGRVLEIIRKSGARNAPLSWRLTETAAPTGTQPFDVVPCLLRAWGHYDLAGGTASPTPAETIPFPERKAVGNG